MKRRFEQGLLKHLAALAIGFGAGMAPAEGLQEIPIPVLDELVAGIEEVEWDQGDRQRMLWLLSQDGRAEVRSRVASKVAVLWPSAQYQTEELLRELARDPSAAVRAAAAVSLEEVLRKAAPVDRIRLVAEWTTSASSEERAAIADALRASTPVFVGDLAIEVLAADPDPMVRELALDAAAHRFDEDPDTYTRVARAAAGDPVERIRRNAQRLLKRSGSC